MRWVIALGVSCGILACNAPDPGALGDGGTARGDGGPLAGDGSIDAGRDGGEGSSDGGTSVAPCTWGDWTVETADDEPLVATWVSASVDSRGVVHVGYSALEGSGVLRYARRATDGTWSRSTVDQGRRVNEFNDDRAHVGGGASLGVVGADRVMIAHVDGTSSDLSLTQVEPGDSDTTTWEFEEVQIQSGAPRALAVAPDGHVAACYSGRMGHDLAMRCVEGPARGPRALVPAPPLGGWAGASLTFDPAGALLVALSSPESDIYLARRSESGAWREELVDTDTRHFVPGLALIGDVPYLGYPVYDPEGNRLRIARPDANDGWDHLEPFSPGSETPVVDSDVSVAAHGDVLHIAYAAEESHEPVHVVGTWDGGFAWSAVPVAARFDRSLDLALDPSGDVVHLVFRSAARTLEYAYRRCE